MYVHCVLLAQQYNPKIMHGINTKRRDRLLVIYLKLAWCQRSFLDRERIKLNMKHNARFLKIKICIKEMRGWGMLEVLCSLVRMLSDTF